MWVRASIFAGLGVAIGLAGSSLASGDERGAVALPEVRREGSVSVERALAQRRSVRRYSAEPLSLAEVAQLLWAAQGVTSGEGGRTAPSAGALYPLEVYLIAGDVSGLAPGAYRYDPKRHRLLPHRQGDLREALAERALEQSWVAEAPALLVFSAFPERTARKYGGRAPRYVQIEVGHAAQNVYLQAVALGLGTVMVGAFEDAPLGRVLGLSSGEIPVSLMPVGRPRVGVPGRPAAD
jgi:SagB-type dehydrogenase family enzyme